MPYQQEDRANGELFLFIYNLFSGNSAVCRTVLSESTTLKERTRAFANLAMWQAVGFAFGPGTF